MGWKTKICGVTNVDDALVVVDVGAHALGLNFYPPSSRYVTEETARAILDNVPRDVLKVGVFVNETAERISAIVASVGLTAIQLHGDEPPKFLTQLPPEQMIIRAHRCGAEGLVTLAAYLAACRVHGRMPDAVLVDAHTGKHAEYGGTGQVADWECVARERDMLGGVPLILAGGLTPENVGTAIEAVRPDGVDVASGVESRPGRKDPALVERFVGEAYKAFSQYCGWASR